MHRPYYDRGHLPKFSEIREGSPKLGAKFFDYYGLVFAEGELGKRVKSLTALAVAHVVQCPYCIDAYTSGSLETGADLEQMTEAIHVASLVRGRSVVLHGRQMLGQASRASMGEGSDTVVSAAYYDRSHLDRAPDIGPLPEKLRDYEASVFEDGALAPDEKQLIALAVAHTIQCPYSIELHSKACLREGLRLEEMTEAVHVAVAIRGGASLIHGIQMMERSDVFRCEENDRPCQPN